MPFLLFFHHFKRQSSNFAENFWTMKNILVPIGISSNAQNTLEYALAMANHYAAQVYVMDSYTAKSPSHLGNIKNVIHKNNFERVKQIIQAVDSKGIDIQLVQYEGDLLTAIASLDEKVELDLIMMGRTPNTLDDKVFLGSSSGKVVKHTNIPVWLVPAETTFTPPKKALFAFKTGLVKGNRSLDILKSIAKEFQTTIQLLLVKTPRNKRADHQIDHEIVELSGSMLSTENATVYQGVLEHFQSVEPDLLTVFARKRGFFEKLIESGSIYKKDFYTTKPLLVLKNRA